ncbi:MAG TPA: right-handed parallel beta-helix repeat-containing protein, partial [Limnochordia bacterium]|nr:right-handed parallel beta-helix repeat-containing protein [Limnochordia bacterium]
MKRNVGDTMDGGPLRSENGARCADVTAFGARGDGRTDDSAAIERAFAAGRGLVTFPRGEYVLSRGITVDLAQTGRLAIVGAGALLRHRGAGPALHLLGRHARSADPKSLDEAVFAGEAMPRVEGLAIAGEHPEADGIRLEGTMQATLQAVAIRGCRHGIHLVKRNRNVIIDSVHVYDNSGVGVYLDHVDLHQINIHGSHISYNQTGGIKVEAGNIRNLQISGNDIEYNHVGGGHDIWLIAGEKGLREAAITGNTIQALVREGGANIRIDGFGPERPLRAGLFSITGNHISSQGTNIRIAHSHGISITGNNFARVSERNIHISDSELIAISANVLDDNTDHRGDEVKGILLTGCTNCTVQGLVARVSYGGSPERGGTIEALNC